MKKVNKI